MNYYQEITLLPDAEISLGFIWQKVFQQVHIALVDNKNADNTSSVAVGFPQYRKAKFPLGSKLRLFAESEQDLEKLNITKWLSRLEDYAHIKAIKAVPDETQYVSFVRKSVKSAARIEKDMQDKVRLRAKHTGESIEQCIAVLEKTKPDVKRELPFIFLHSQETKQRSPNAKSKFPLFIELKSTKQQQSGVFDCYGLSAKNVNGGQNATVPHF
ncbi:type I-F CRISPR-associated endoribonuclease Cas6/Csy4 [Shewanella sp. WXL01]|uniref:type I-F CRISPR-associated endoribonuclease Cas6/Csy4 n=1 Tax=Shewanella sp. WXL01 TaxID=2709721 RepID=UPI00143832B8|nr:type I-F CRISPR-associated endoribonuclease Cas6/Csy4 [Shewanella sp. WXL01]NKF51197.1 type I-F CRISPR-associated endoribonuclease Cas6/Csy4 [Shewanella sp. WXL01]